MKIKLQGNKPIASLSLDLDNVWSFLKTSGDKLLRIQLALSGRAGCPPHNHLEKILVQIKGATAYPFPRGYFFKM